MFSKGFIAGAIALMMLVVPAGASAIDIRVTTTEDQFGEDPNNCSLREALVSARDNASLGGCTAGAGADTILLPGGVYKITRAGAEEDSGSTGDFDIGGADSLEIRPEGPTDRVIVDGNGLDRVFDKLGAGQVNINSIRIKRGKLTAIEDGGGVRVAVGNLTMDSVTVDGNETAYQGGGIAVYAGLTLRNSTVSGNRSGGSGGGIYAPGGSIAQAFSTTIVNNVADSDGDGNGVGGGFAEAGAISISFTNVLNAGNDAAPPAAAERFNDCSSGPFYFPRHTLQSQLFGPADCLIANNPGTNRVSFEPQVGPLGYHGGQTPTHNLLLNSSAIGAGGTVAPDTCPTIDQNGVGRPVGSCDIGSVQFVPTPNLVIRNVLPKRKAIKRNRARMMTIIVRNSGTGPAVGLRGCLVLPKAAKKGLKVRGKACKKAGNLAVGQVKRVKIRLAAKRGAKKRNYRLRAVVRANGAKQKAKAFRVRVK